ncbi:hypothetical protein COJ46_14745 [Bacillus sp. AFS077874]|uniref:hypothetical protein n=1 Tax=unclassified Bacillus (in: firmicutes) TaxID=185979 RepID=UPI000BEBA4D6|nr:MULTISPECIES: hypothetical protein [unclassified Bacillus (in: firmicutes)]PEC49795.1 hypothetical protein CON00_07975 [Bacillus sp. AFS096315]PFM79530.1 hypothetical protein COJ46_14745 [Bacillus sp. AFS077874]
MKRKYKYIILFLACFLVIYSCYVVVNKMRVSPFIVNEETIRKNNFLDDKEAVLYYSSTADQDMDNRGISIAIFINDDGVARGYKMKGLELGSVGLGETGLLIEDKETLRLIGNKYKEVKMKYQHTGEITGYLKSSNLFFTIFNSGFVKNGYASNVLYGNENGFEKENIPHYIYTSGVDKNDILILTEDNETCHLRKVDFDDNKLKIKDLTQLKKRSTYNSYGPSSQIISDENYHYMVLEERKQGNLKDEKVVLVRIYKKTLKQDMITLVSYQNKTINQLTAKIPYSPNHSIYLYGKQLFYANGLGEVYSVDTTSNLVKKKFTIENPRKGPYRYGEQTYFKNDSMFVVRYDSKRKLNIILNNIL